MTDLLRPPIRRAIGRRIDLRLILFLAALSLGVGIVTINRAAIGARLAEAKPMHLPELSLLAAQSPVVQAHVGLALAAVVLGGVMLMSRKGARFHRIAGWTWAALMSATAASTFAIPAIAPGTWSYIHITSGWVLVGLPIGLVAARRHKVVAHRRSMLWLYWGFLIGAAAFTFVPGRLMWELFFA
jgi:uncharacterized membrane protein